MPPEPVRLQTIADALGLSRAAVSMALRNHPEIAAETRARVLNVARRLGYRANPYVSAWMRYVQHPRRSAAAINATLGFITAHDTRGSWGRTSPAGIARHVGAVARAKELGFRLEEFWAREPGMTPRRLSQILQARNIAGLFICPLPEPSGTLGLDWSRFAAVSVGESLQSPRLHRVINHYQQMAGLMFSELALRGYERIGFVTTRNHNERVGRVWEANFLLQQQSVPQRRRLRPLVMETWNEDQAAAWVLRERPDVVATTTIELADTLRHAGRKIPEDIGLAHFDVPHADPCCSGLFHDHEALGAAVIDQLAGMLYRNERGVPVRPLISLVEGRWQEGATLRARPNPAVV